MAGSALLRDHRLSDSIGPSILVGVGSTAGGALGEDMAHMESSSLVMQRWVWTIVIGVGALLFAIVGLGAGMRAWIKTTEDVGIVAHAQAFGEDAYIWWIPATILLLTAAVMAIGVSIVRHLVDGPAGVVPASEVSPGPEPESVEARLGVEPVEKPSDSGADRGGASE